jgi:aldehyde dehydrogenase (NAD+)
VAQLCMEVFFNFSKLIGKFDVKERYIEPTLILNPRDDSLLMKEEIFGPILPIIEWDNID